MMPAYRYMGSYPFHGNQASSAQEYHPGFEHVSPHIMADPSKTAVAFEPWPYAPNNFGCPMLYASCCSHGNFPGYYGFRPQCSHFSPPQFHCCGYYPPYPGGFPVQFVPPLHHSMEQPRYEYDKGVMADQSYHCCGWPNHTHNHQRDGNSVKVEEQEPDGEKKKKNSNLLVPSKLKDCPYPIVWIPPDYMKNREDRKPISEVGSRKEALRDVQPADSKEPNKMEPRAWNRWFPLDIKSLALWMQGQDWSRIENQHSEGKREQFSFPIVWMPSSNKQDEANKEDDGKKNTVLSNAVEGPHSEVKFYPLKLSNSADTANKPQDIRGDAGGHQVPEKNDQNVIQKTVPVKQVEDFGQQSKTEDTERREKDLTMKTNEEQLPGKAPEASAKRQSSFPSRTSKLPPVCLRVDLLPKKRNGNGNSRSPSPLGLKRLSKETLNDNCKAAAPLDLRVETDVDKQASDSAVSGKVEGQAKKAREGIKVAERKTDTNDEEGRSKLAPEIPFPANSQPEASKCQAAERTMEEGDEYENSEDERLKNGRCLVAKMLSEAKEANKLASDETKAERKKLSEEGAAVLIQSAYRGFEVRKWEPLKKLKQMAKVREQMVELSNRISSLESSFDQQKDERQRAVIGEMIMKLLLKLDTILGLHPSLRDVRKTLARELVVLQEKLDSLGVKKSEEAAKDRPLESSSVDNENVLTVEEGQNGVRDGMVDAAYDAQGNEISVPFHIVEEDRKSEDDARGKLIAHDPQQGENVGSSEYQLRGTEMAGNQQSEILPPEEKSGAEEFVSVLLERGELAKPVEDKESTPMEGTPEVHECRELPVGVIDEEPVTLDKAREQVQSGTTAANHHGGMESDASGDVNLPPLLDQNTPEKNILAELTYEVGESEKQQTYEMQVLRGQDDLTTAEETPEMTPMFELSIGIIDADEGEKCGKSELQEGEVLCGGDMEYKVTFDQSSLDKDNDDKSELQQREVTDGALSDVEPNDSVMKEFPKVECESGYALLDPEVGNQNGEAGIIDKGRAEVLGPEGVQQLCPQAEKESNEVGEGDHQLTTEASQAMFTSQETEVPIEEDKDNRTNGQERNEQGVVTERAEGSSLVEQQSPPLSPEQCEEEMKLLPASSTAGQASVDAGGMGTYHDRKLGEENQRLREMMEKLMDAGREQLTAISNLTARVKDLEKKLAKKKRMRTTRRCRTALSSPSRARSTNESLREGVAGVAM